MVDCLNYCLNTKVKEDQSWFHSYAIATLKEELKDPEGFSGYKEVQLWLLAVLGVEANYHVVHRLVRYQLNAKLKSSRPRSSEQNPEELNDFKKNYQTIYSQ